jgi:Leucine-rich repeat (LRR) protein
LDYNIIEVIDERLFSSLSQLKRLGLAHNRLSFLGKNLFRNLTSLEVIFLENNRLLHLASVFENLTQLKWLYLGDNFFTTADSTVFSSINNLNELNVYFNESKLEFSEFLSGLCRKSLKCNISFKQII